jgi:hypothetical protein
VSGTTVEQFHQALVLLCQFDLSVEIINLSKHELIAVCSTENKTFPPGLLEQGIDGLRLPGNFDRFHNSYSSPRMNNWLPFL